MKRQTCQPVVPSRIRLVAQDTPAENAARLSRGWDQAASAHAAHGNMRLWAASVNVADAYASTARLLAILEAETGDTN